MDTSSCLDTVQNRKTSCSSRESKGPGSVVGIATGYGLDGPGIEYRWGARLSAPVQTGPGAHPASCTMGTGSFPGVNSGRGVTLTPHPLLVPLVMKEYSYTSTPPVGHTACTEPECLYIGALYLYLGIENQVLGCRACSPAMIPTELPSRPTQHTE